MKIKTSDLTGAALDWAVAKCATDDTLRVYFDEATGEPLCHDDWLDNQEYKPSTDWAQGGPIIEREGIELEHDGFIWWSRIKADEDFSGPTPLIAAMRCYVASVLGDEVDVPEGL
jgi:Protein of unknown function (DUF2591)